MPRALLSVSDKTGLVDFARELERRGWTLLSMEPVEIGLEGIFLSVTGAGGGKP